MILSLDFIPEFSFEVFDMEKEGSIILTVINATTWNWKDEKICNLLLGLALVSVPLLGTELASLHQGEGCHKHHNEESCPLHYFDSF